MKMTLQRFWREEHGFFISSEVVLAGSLLVIGGVAGWTALRESVVEEMADVSTAIGNLDQSYAYSGVAGHGAFTAGSSFLDRSDNADRGFAINPNKILVCADVFGSTAVAQSETLAAAPAPVSPPAPVPVAPAAPAPCPPVAAVASQSAVVTVTTTTITTSLVPQQVVTTCAAPIVAPPCPPPVAVLPPAPVVQPVGPMCASVLNTMMASQGMYGCGHPAGFGGCPHCLGWGLPEGYNVGPKILFTPPPVHAAPARVRAPQLQSVDMRFNVVGDEQLKQLSSMPGVRVLQIAGSGVTDAGLVYLKKLGELEELHLVGSEITDAGLVHLAEIKTLKRLHIVSAGITDKSIDSLLKLKQLQMLSLPWSQITAQGWGRLEAGLSSLQIVR